MRRLTAIRALFHGLSLVVAVAGAETSRDAALHFKPPGGWVADVHPFHARGEWQMAYLQPPAEPLRGGLFGMHSALMSSKDLLHWSPREVVAPPGRAWWLIAMLVGEDGTAYAYYNDAEGIALATSSDLRQWTVHPRSPVVRYADAPVRELRDPSVFHHKAAGEYWLVFAVRVKGDLPRGASGGFYYTTSKDLVNWSPLKPLLVPGNIGAPECPELFEMGGRYYLVGGPGTFRTGKGTYWVADKPEGPWRRARTDSFNGDFVPVPNSATDGTRRLQWGWIPTFVNDQDFGNHEFGGHLSFPREMYAAPDGALYVRPPAELASLRDGATIADASSFTSVKGDWSNGLGRLQASGGYAEALATAPCALFELDTTITLGSDCPSAGFVFRAGSPDFAGYEVAVDRRHQQIQLRHHRDAQRVLIAESAEIVADEPMRLRVFVDHSIVEVFLADKFSLGARAHEMRGDMMGFCSQNGKFTVENPRVFSLTAIPRPVEPPAVNLVPQPDAGRPGGSVLFANTSSNAWCGAQPALDLRGDLTIECWAKPTSTPLRMKRNLVAKADEGKGYHYGLNLLGNDSAELYLRTSGGFVGTDSPPGSAGVAGEWSHLAGVVDRGKGEIRLYRNGKQIARKTVTIPPPIPPEASSLRLGVAAGLGTPDQFFGLMDEVRIWSVARSESQIAGAFDRLLAGEDRAGLVVYWDMQGPKAAARTSFARQEFPNLAEANPLLILELYDGAKAFPEDALRR
jgi:sucrose-6-phosphate hydrolase SacC (GH32 family)